MPVMDGSDRPAATPASDDVARLRPAAAVDSDDTTCPRCGESHDLAKVKGCLKCLACGFKFDCNGW
jgi:ribosomal protein S27AE